MRQRLNQNQQEKQKQGGIKGKLQQRKCRINTQLLHTHTRAQAKHTHRLADWSNNRTYFVLHMSTRARECTKSASRLVGVGKDSEKRDRERERERRPSKSKAKANDRKSTGAAM